MSSTVKPSTVYGAAKLVDGVMRTCVGRGPPTARTAARRAGRARAPTRRTRRAVEIGHGDERGRLAQHRHASDPRDRPGRRQASKLSASGLACPHHVDQRPRPGVARPRCRCERPACSSRARSRCSRSRRRRRPACCSSRRSAPVRCAISPRRSASRTPSPRSPTTAVRPGTRPLRRLRRTSPAPTGRVRVARCRRSSLPDPYVVARRPPPCPRARSTPSRCSPVRARSSTCDFVARRAGPGALVPQSFADRAAAAARRSACALGRRTRSVTGIYRDIAPSAFDPRYVLPRYWCAWSGEIVPTVFSRPPPFVLVDRGRARRGRPAGDGDLVRPDAAGRGDGAVADRRARADDAAAAAMRPTDRPST